MAVAQENRTDTLEYKLDIDFSGVRSSGVFSRITFRAGVNFILTQNKWEFHNNASYQFNNTNGNKLLDNWMNVAYLQYHLESVWKWFPIALYQFETNYIYQVKTVIDMVWVLVHIQSIKMVIYLDLLRVCFTKTNYIISINL